MWRRRVEGAGGADVASGGVLLGVGGLDLVDGLLRRLHGERTPAGCLCRVVLLCGAAQGQGGCLCCVVGCCAARGRRRGWVYM